jgi:hydrogenase nickel incorporation protein HypA/HybF
MHELSLVRDLVDSIAERCAGRRVTRVILEVGKLAAVVPDAMLFCFELCVAGTVAEGAKLEILETPGAARCRACGVGLAVDNYFETCACGSGDLELLAGTELRLKAVEVI